RRPPGRNAAASHVDPAHRTEADDERRDYLLDGAIRMAAYRPRHGGPGLAFESLIQRPHGARIPRRLAHPSDQPLVLQRVQPPLGRPPAPGPPPPRVPPPPPPLRPPP